MLQDIRFTVAKVGVESYHAAEQIFFRAMVEEPTEENITKWSLFYDEYIRHLYRWLDGKSTG